MATIAIRVSGCGVPAPPDTSHGSAVVVMEPPENGDSRDTTRGLARTGNRLLLPESLVRTRLVVEPYELRDEAVEVALAHEENVVEQLPAEGAREPFGERVHVRRPGRNPHDLRPRRGEHAGEASAELRVAVADDDRRRRVQGGIPGLLGAPLVAWHVGDRRVDDPTSPELEEEQHEDRAEPNVVGLHEVARPRDVIPQEGRPALPVASGSRAAHVPLDSSFADPDAELEQLAADALGAPARIAGGYLADQRRPRRRRSPQWPRASSPEHAEACPVPAQDGRRLDEKRGV